MMPDVDLFAAASAQVTDLDDITQVAGLTYQSDFLTFEECRRVVEFVDQRTWIDDLSRRVQHYGYRYNYKSRGIDDSMRADPLPEWAVRIGNRLVKRGFFDSPPDQVIINEYLPGQGIAQHVDCVPCFRDVIASVSLLSPCLMTFDRRCGSACADLDLLPGSLVVLTGEARYDWRHGIAARQSDLVAGVRRRRRRRVSLTFRSVILDRSAASGGRQAGRVERHGEAGQAGALVVALRPD